MVSDGKCGNSGDVVRVAKHVEPTEFVVKCEECPRCGVVKGVNHYLKLAEWKSTPPH